MFKFRKKLTIKAAADNSPEQVMHIVEAAAQPLNDLKKCDGVAYSGGIIRQAWSQYEMVVDTAGIKMASQIALLFNHYNSPDYRLGEVKASIIDSAVHINGGISASTEQAKNIIQQGKDFDWQLSIGADINRMEFVEAGVKVTVNNREFTGPLNIVRESLLREVSIVAVGADAETHLKIAAKFNSNNNPNESTKIQGGHQMNEEMLQFIIAKFGLDAQTDSVAAAAHIKTIGLAEADIQAMMPVASKENESVNAKIVAAGVDTQPATVVAAAAPAKPAAPASTETDIQAMVAKQVEAALKQNQDAENTRITQIKAICGDDNPTIQAKAIADKWTVEATTTEVLKAMRENRPHADFSIIASRPLQGADQKNSIVAALCLRAGFAGDELIAAYGAKAVEAGDQFRGISLKEVMAQSLMLEGKSVSGLYGNDNELIRAAFSSVSLPGILSNVANKKMLKSFTGQPIIATKLCSEGDLNDFKESQRYRLTDVGDLEKIGQDGELKSGGLSEDSATNQLGTYGKLFTLTRQMIINDDLNAFLKIPQNMGNKAARKIDQLFFERLLANPNSLFSTGNKNYFSGTTSGLSKDSLSKGLQMFKNQVDSDGQPISIAPKFLLVPTELEGDAIELTQSPTLIMAGGTDAVRPSMNSISKYNLDVVGAPYLSSAAYTGSSSKAWYLFGDPGQVDTFEIGYLKGKRTPTVETGTVDFNTLGISYRVYFDLGVREQDHRGMVKSKGEN